MLSIHDHNRSISGLSYVYPVVSRRAEGVSVGINLNTNNACNWACVYCQVPNLVRGAPEPIDIPKLESELRFLLNEILHGDFMQKNVPTEFRKLVDIAFSGNGEPTSSHDFPAAVQSTLRIMEEFELQKSIKLRLITNGSLMHRPSTQTGVKLIGDTNGEVWFKVDRATPAGIELVNKIKLDIAKHKEALLLCCDLAPTWVQTCCFAYDGQSMQKEEISAYISFLDSVKGKIKGVHLYGIARPSMQPEADKLSEISKDVISLIINEIKKLKLEVTIHP